MPWVSRVRYESLLRAAHRSMQDGVKDDFSQRLSYSAMLLWRLNPSNARQSGELWQSPFEYMHAVDFGEKIVVFILTGSGPVTFEDNKAMFPSDELVAKLRLLLK